MNVELLQQVKAAILGEPQHFRMDTWSCGTAHCIAGWALKLTGNQIVNVQALRSTQVVADGTSAHQAAIDVLDIDHEQGSALFNVDSWPPEFERRYEDADRGDAPEKYARLASIAAERIDYFIEHGDTNDYYSDSDEDF